MLRYAALAFLLCSGSSAFSTSEAGNIGCLFSETLCNQEKEWCYDDFAFGRCLPLYGNVREEDMHRYELGTAELHGLEVEMQRLFLLGYRWSHTYTQCVLQVHLSTIRTNIKSDVSNCNAELDQDLEGALKAIEGEETEHVDPRNLAIVRFTPSVLNPHSDYADELYYPPVEEMLTPISKSKEEEEEESENEKDKPTEEESKPDSVPPSAVKEDSPEELKVPKPQIGRGPNSISDHLGLSPAAIPMPSYQDDQPYPLDSDDYDYDLSYNPYRQMYKRNGVGAFNVPPPLSFGELGNYHKKPMQPNDLRELANMLNSFRHFRTPSNRDAIAEQPIYYGNTKLNGVDYLGNANRNYVNEENQGFFREVPSLPSFRERPSYPTYANGPNSVYAPPFESEYKLRGSPYDYRTNIPELNPPEKEQDVPETIHAGFVKEFEEQNYQNDQAQNLTPYNNPTNNMHIPYNPNINNNIHAPYNQPNINNPYNLNSNNDPYNNNINDPYNNNLNDPYNLNNEEINNNYKFQYEPETSSYSDNSVSRFEQEAGNNFNFDSYEKPNSNAKTYDWENKPTNNEKSYQMYKDTPPSYSANSGALPQGMQQGLSQDQQLNRDYLYGGGRPMYPPYTFNPYDYEFYYDYGGPDYLDLDAQTPWNFQRDERLDVKKPGPMFKSDNDFAFQQKDDKAYMNPDYLTGDSDWMSRMNPMNGEAPMGHGGFAGGNKEGLMQNNGRYPDLVLTEEGFVEKVSNDARRRGKQGMPTAAHMISNKNTGIHNKEPGQQDSYVYISISGEFGTLHEANQFVGIILAEVGLQQNSISNLSIDKNQVMFHLKNNIKEMSAAQLAERTEELRDTIKEKTGMEITKSGVGTKSALSAVVYDMDERQMFTAAAIVCGVCAALLVAASALFFLRQNARSKAKLQGLTARDTEASKDYQDLCRARMSGKGDSKDSGPGHAHPVGSNGSSHAPGQRISSLSKESENGNNSPSSRSSTSSWSEEPVISNMDISTGHMVLSYMEDHLNNKDRLEQEWVALCAYEAEPCSCNLALKPENAQKNRYNDIVPYDHNRVILNEHTNVTGSNYVNASSITDHDPRNPAYIATQGPLASTAADFWQLVWEQGSVVIVMLTRLTENGQALCHRYWPEEGSELYHIYEVHLVSEHIWCDDYLVRSFYLKNVRTGETRTVTQFHFLSWPESGIPASTKALLEFRRKVNKSYRGRSCPIIVHCSDGIGRSGTYCLIDMVLNRMAKGAKEIDIAATLEHIRDQRPSMVKTKTQFEFVLMAVAEEVHAILKALPQ